MGLIWTLLTWRHLQVDSMLSLVMFVVVRSNSGRVVTKQTYIDGQVLLQ